MDLLKRVIHAPVVQVGCISIGFVMVYPLLRSLPDTECEFLHFDYVGETGVGSEYCGADAATFIDLERLSFPVQMELDRPYELEPGRQATFSVSFRTSGGRLIPPWELAVVHTEKIHLLVIDPSLEDYHHVHPEPVGNSGNYTFSVSPQRPGLYNVFAEFVPIRSRSIVIARAEFTVAGRGGYPRPGASAVSEVDGYRFELEFANGSPAVAIENAIRLSIRRPSDGGPVPLEELMGAYAHMVAFDARRRGFAHMHPLDGGSGIGSPEATFGFSLKTDLPGYYKVWAQVKVDRREVFAPFDLMVEL